jgi:hypothetical protein
LGHLMHRSRGVAIGFVLQFSTKGSLKLSLI